LRIVRIEEETNGKGKAKKGNERRKEKTDTE
jgi:hypothetical protein